MNEVEGTLIDFRHLFRNHNLSSNTFYNGFDEFYFNFILINKTNKNFNRV